MPINIGMLIVTLLSSLFLISENNNLFSLENKSFTLNIKIINEYKTKELK